MTRIRSPHEFHEVTIHDPESICLQCKNETTKVCSWCGKCLACHKDTKEKDY